MKYIFWIVILLASVNVCFSQIELAKPKIIESVRLNEGKPTVYVDYLCENDKNIYLKLHNNTIWIIGIWTYKSYSLTKKAIPRNGTLYFVIPNNEEVQMFYYVERDEITGKKIKVKQPDHPARGGGGEIVSGDAVIFPVKKEYLKRGLKIYFQISYQWSPPGDIGKEPEYRVYFRGGDINSLNTGIKSKPCS